MKKIKFLLIDFVRNLKWKKQYFKVKKKYELNEKILSNNTIIAGKVLIIVPHADDELIGCFNFIKNYKSKADITLFFCNLTGSNNNLNNKLNRELEFQNFCKTYQIKNIINTEEDVYVGLKHVLMNNKFNFFFITPLIDWHFEHREVNYILYDILNESYSKEDLKVKNIVFYQISVPLNYNCVNFILGMNKEVVKEKWSAFSKFYPSQANLPKRRFIYQERLNALKCKDYFFAAESFQFLTFDSWCSFVEDIRFRQNFKFNASTINDLFLIRESVKNYK
ncbi:hypothetical protein [Myroides injenensis]|uniref:hypothetical protein n=1 Tax=Myroides injenensis TaxID=1183151 RepID=UPI0002892776|nr:hypothetical protein [Myroides injenensis]